MLEIVKLLQEVAKRGYYSEPVEHWLNKDEKQQVVSFTAEERTKVNKFLGDNPHISKMGRHSLYNPFNEKETSRTVSLSGRISYAVSSRNITPDYVLGLATELEESVKDYTTLWEVAELNKLV